MDKTVENRKNLAHYIIPTFKTDYLDVVGLVFTISNFYIDKIQINWVRKNTYLRKHAFTWFFFLLWNY